MTIIETSETSSSGRLDRLNVDGDGMIFYPSGNIAVIICKSPDGQILTLMSDSEKNSKVLVSFDQQGVGAVTYKNGKPWLVVTLEGWTVSSKEGDITARGKYPTVPKVPIICDAAPGVTVTFSSRQEIKLEYRRDQLDYEWQCGENLKRTEVYTSLVLGEKDGRLELDVSKIRERQAAVGSVYVPPGPHTSRGPLQNTGSSKSGVGSAMTEVLSQLDSQAQRLKQIDTLPVPLYGTARPSSTQLLAGTLTDFGSPVLSSVQQHYMKTMKRATVGKPNYQPRRMKLEAMSMKDVEAQVDNKAGPKDTVIFVCILADWSPVCSRLDMKLQAGWHSLQEAAKANAGSEEAHIQVVKVDASEGNSLMKRYDFRSVPQFLALFEGRLVAATNSIRTPEELIEEAKNALAAGRRGHFLPETFSFGGKDNALLDSINPHMSLLR